MARPGATRRSDLLERSRELGELRGLVDAATCGRGSLCLIEGPAGIGKTALLEACREQAADAGVRSLYARAGQLERDLPWGLVRRLFHAVIAAPADERTALLSGAAALAAPVLGLVPGGDDGALHGLYWLTDTLASTQPLVVAVDDAHWGDLPSLRYLNYLAERVDDLAVCLVIAVRRGEDVPGPLAALAARPRRELIQPRELSADASATLVRTALGANAAGEFCAACHAATNGNPFFLRELLAELQRDGIEPSAQRADDVAQVTPETVTRTVLLRLSRLSREAEEFAPVVALLGEDARLAEAGRLAGLEPGQAASAADALVEAGILSAGVPLAFTHPLIRDALYRAIPPHRRALLHGEAAPLLAAAGARRDRVAAHLLASEPQHDPWVVAQLREAAEVALAEGAPATAADLLARAWVEPPSEGDRPHVLIELGRAELAAGRPEATARVRTAVEMLVEPRDRARALLDLGRALYVAGKPRDAADALDRGLLELGAAGAHEPSLIAELQAAWLSVARTEVPLRARATELLGEIGRRPPRGESYGERALLAQVAGQLTFEGEPRELPLELARLALGDGDLIRQETSDGNAWVAAMGALGWGDDFDAYEDLHADAMEDARRRGSVIGFAAVSYGLSFSHYYRGMLGRAIADAEQAIAAERDGWRQFLPAARAQLAWTLTERGELDAAAATLERARSDPTWEQSAMQALVLEAEARVQLARGQNERALETALEAGRILEQALIINPSIVPWRSRAAIAAARVGRVDEAEALLDEALALARRFGAPRPLGVALTARGMVRGAAGVEVLEEAVEVLAASPARLEHTRALVYLGAALRRRGKVKAAREILEAGHEASVACEALALEDRARVELAAAGARPRRRRFRGVEALTPAELRVAKLAARQQTNREIAESLFVSLRTVETHLTHAYRKLGIDSRVKLVTALQSTEGDA